MPNSARTDLESRGLSPVCRSVFPGRLQHLDITLTHHKHQLLLQCLQRWIHSPPHQVGRGSMAKRANRTQQDQERTQCGSSKGTWLNPVPPTSLCCQTPLLTTYLLRNLACTLYQLLLGVGIAGAALQGSSLGDQGSTAMTQLLHPALDVGANLQRNVCVTESGGN